MKKSKNIIAFVLVAIIGTIIFWKRDLIKEKFQKATNLNPAKSVKQNVSPPPSSSPMPSAEPTPCNSFPLKLGCAGSKVRLIQKALNMKYNAGLVVDGHFGLLTEKALENAGFGKELDNTELVKLTIW